MIEWMSKAGSYHNQLHMENQDVVLYDSTRRLTGLFLADGVSQCARAARGARRSCEAMKDLLMKKGECFFSLEEREIADFAAAHIYHELQKEASGSGEPVEEYASTMAGVLLDNRSGKLLAMNLGDGLIAGVRDGAVKILAAPDDSSNGCCCTTTLGAARRTAVHFADARELDAVFICSDGAWKALFDGGRISSRAGTLLRSKPCGALAQLLTETDTFDDCSFICMDLKGNGGWSNEPEKVLK